jgi:ribosomal protein S18 acetylase RimI-like enzyme
VLNRGPSRTVLERVILGAAEAGKPVRLSVPRMNIRAFELYRRLGFEVCSEDEMYVEMKRDA